MEGILGRPLEPWEDVHHKDENKANNNPDNLEVKSHGRHTTEHRKGKRGNTKGQKLTLTDDERASRSMRAIAKQLWNYSSANKPKERENDR
jgi:hypothetical protein